MKGLFLWPLLVGTSVQASSYQEFCSNGEGTVKLTQGHIYNEISVTERIRNEGQFLDKRVVLPDADVLILKAELLEQEKSNPCDDDFGIIYWREVVYKKIRITNPDGSLFSQNIVGVSRDKRFVEASVICEAFGNSIYGCAEQKHSDL